MTYKKVINEIEGYKNKYNEVVGINGEHGKNYNKKKMLLDANNNYLASLAALFDFDALSVSKVIYDEKQVNDHLDFIKQTKEKEKISTQKGNDKLILIQDKLKRFDDYVLVYTKVFLDLLNCPRGDFNKIHKYASKVRLYLLKNEQRRKIDEDNWFISFIYSEIKKYYDDYNQALQNEVDRVSRGGNQIDEFIKNRLNSSIKYTLLVKAVKDAYEAEGNGFGKKESVVRNYYNKFCDGIDEDVFSFLDEKSQATYQSGLYDSYANAFKKTYDLSPGSKKKLSKKISKLS